MAIEHNIGCVVIDNFYEIELLEQLLKKHNKKMNALIRVTPGIEANTHDYIMTGNEDSKFGFNLSNGQADQAFELLRNHESIHFKDRKSTRLNSSHVAISYAVFCLKKKNKYKGTN